MFTHCYLSTSLLGTSSSVRVEFYDNLRREADECDRDFIKKYDEDSNTTLIFVSILFTCTSVAVFIWFSRGAGRFVLRDYIRFRSRRSRESPTGLPEKRATTSSGLSPVSLARECSERHQRRFRYMVWPRSHCRLRPAILYSSLVVSLAAFTPMLG